MHVGDRVLYDALEFGWVPAVVQKVQPGDLHREPLYWIRLDANSAELFARPDRIKRGHANDGP